MHSFELYVILKLLDCTFCRSQYLRMVKLTLRYHFCQSGSQKCWGPYPSGSVTVAESQAVDGWIIHGILSTDLRATTHKKSPVVL